MSELERPCDVCGKESWTNGFRFRPDGPLVDLSLCAEHGKVLSGLCTRTGDSPRPAASRSVNHTQASVFGQIGTVLENRPQDWKPYTFAVVLVHLAPGSERTHLAHGAVFARSVEEAQGLASAATTRACPPQEGWVPLATSVAVLGPDIVQGIVLWDAATKGGQG